MVHAELKFIGAIPTFYPSTRLASYRGGGHITPVMRRVRYYPKEGGIQAEYEAKARSVDGPLGLVQLRLKALGKVKGWVVGAYGEMSDDLLDHVKGMAESKLKVPLASAPGAASVVVEHPGLLLSFPQRNPPLYHQRRCLQPRRLKYQRLNPLSRLLSSRLSSLQSILLSILRSSQRSSLLSIPLYSLRSSLQ